MWLYGETCDFTGGNVILQGNMWLYRGTCDFTGRHVTLQEACGFRGWYVYMCDDILLSFIRIRNVSREKKVKVTLVQALRLCTGRTARRGSRGIALPFHDHGTRRGWRVSVTPRPLFTPRKEAGPIVQEAGWAAGPVWTGVENLAPIGIRSPDRTVLSQSLYRLRYPATF